MDQLHKNRFQVAKHRPGLNIKAELLFKITAEGDLESEMRKGSVAISGKTNVCIKVVHTHTHTYMYTQIYTHSPPFSLTSKVSYHFSPSRTQRPC